MKTLEVFSFFILLASIAFAVDANFQNNHPAYGDRFNTDMSFSTSFTLSLVSGSVASGDQNNLQTGDAVCAGSVLRITPSSNTKWANTFVDIYAAYPECTVAYCPAMVSSGGVSTNKNIKWISDAIYTEHNDYGDSGGDYVFDWGTAFAQDKYNDLATFYNEPVTWVNSTSEYANKEGGANVFCKGSLVYKDGGTTIDSLAMPTSATKDFTITGTGSHTISTSLGGVECFGAMVKHPLDQSPYPSFFYLYYFTKNQPTIGATATASKAITVQASGGTCAMHDISVTPSSSLTSEDDIMLRVRMHNDGDPIQVNGVSSSNPGYTVSAFPVAACAALGFPSGLCPSSNGFGESIAAAANKDLYVLLHRNPGASGCPTLTFSAATVSGACGGSSSCSDSVTDLCTVWGCEVTPASLTLGTNEVAQFDVGCTDISGNPMTCIGNSWYWGGGLTGGFIEQTNTQAQAYTTSPPGSSGTLNYHSGHAYCHSDINTVTPTYECELVPPSSTLNYDISKFFKLNGFVSGSSSAPDSATYDLIDGLGGSLDNESTNGVTYTSPSAEDTGRIQAFAEYSAAPDPILGAVCFSSITVHNETIPGGNNTTDGGDDHGPGSSQWCTIGSGPLNVYPGYSGWVGIMCGPHALDPCVNVTWSTTGGVSISGSNDDGSNFEITGSPGDSCRINAYVNNTPSQSCYKPCYITTPECWEFT